MSFGAAVRKRRKSLGLTLEQLAERSGLTPNFIGSVENGQRDPSLSTVEALAKGLRTPVGELLAHGGKEPSSEALELARVYDGLSPDLQDAVLRLVRTLARRRR